MCPALDFYFPASLAASCDPRDANRSHGKEFPGNLLKEDMLAHQGGTSFMPFTSPPTSCLDQGCDGQHIIGHLELCCDIEDENNELKILELRDFF